MCQICCSTRVSYLPMGQRVFGLPLGWADSAGIREVTLLQRPRNNGLFFPGSLLHPQSCPTIGPQRLTIHQDRKLWQTGTTFSANQPFCSEVTHFQSHFLWWNQCSHLLAAKRHFRNIKKCPFQQWTEDCLYYYESVTKMEIYLAYNDTFCHHHRCHNIENSFQGHSIAVYHNVFLLS